MNKEFKFLLFYSKNLSSRESITFEKERSADADDAGIVPSALKAWYKFVKAATNV